MSIFEKKQKDSKNSFSKEKIKPTETKIKKRKRIGFKHVTKTKKEKQIVKNEIKSDDKQIDETWELTNGEDLDTIVEDKKIIIKESEVEKKSPKKKKTIIKKDMKGKPVYLEDTGEKLGVVFDSIYDKKNNLVGFKIKDKKSDAILSFPLDQFDQDKDGLIFIPGWYTNAVKTIEKLEFKDKISPELTALISDDSVTNNELYDIFVKHDDDMADYIENALSLKEILNNRLKVLEKQRLVMKDNLIDLTEKRLIKDIDRREFSQDVMEHRRKANILDVNINKCKDLTHRLDSTSFGMLGKNVIVDNTQPSIDDNFIEKIHQEQTDNKKTVLRGDIQVPYKDKYYALREEFQHLEEEYHELKSSVEKLFGKNEI